MCVNRIYLTQAVAQINATIFSGGQVTYEQEKRWLYRHQDFVPFNRDSSSIRGSTGSGIGDGVAIIPRDGKLVSPIDGEVVSVAETLHAYGLRSKDGIEVMVHFGLETVALKGEFFTCHVKQGDKVKAGDLLAEADIQMLEEKQVNLITPVLI